LVSNLRFRDENPRSCAELSEQTPNTREAFTVSDQLVLEPRKPVVSAHRVLEISDVGKVDHVSPQPEFGHAETEAAASSVGAKRHLYQAHTDLHNAS
jgi:hypothetical protein